MIVIESELYGEMEIHDSLENAQERLNYIWPNDEITLSMRGDDVVNEDGVVVGYKAD